MPSLTLIADDGGREGFQSVLLQIDIAGCQEDFVTKKPMFENQWFLVSVYKKHGLHFALLSTLLLYATK